MKPAALGNLLPRMTVVALCMALVGLVAGARLFQRPKTVIQVVTIKWTADAAPEQRKAALDAIEKVAAAAPGVRNVWLRTIRTQPRDFMTAFAFEFEDLPSAERFHSLPAYELWKKTYLPLIEESRTQEVGN